MLDIFDTIRGKVIGDSKTSRFIVSDDQNGYRLKCSTALPVGSKGLFTITGYSINFEGTLYRADLDSMEYEIA